MSDENLLFLFGFSAIIFPILYIGSRFLNGKAHLCTTLNATLVGYIPFIGFSTIAFSTRASAIQTPYANYSTEDIHSMIIAVIIFTAALLFTYSQVRPVNRLQRLMAKQPTHSRSQPIVVAAIAFCLTLACLLPRLGLDVPVLSEWLTRSMSASVIFAALFSFAGWWKDRSNIGFFSGFIAVFTGCIVLAVLTGSGRRAMLGVIMAIGVYAYWNGIEKFNRGKIVLTGGIFLAATFVFIMAYNQVRHFDRKGDKGQERNVTNAIAALGSIPEKLISMDFDGGQTVSDIGQNTTNCALYSIYLSKRVSRSAGANQLRYPSFFHSIFFVVSNPIPRRFWETKPLALGYLLPHHFQRGMRVNWGPGIVGHFYHEGGLPLAIFYGLLMGFLLKQMDVLLMDFRDNNFCIAFTSSVIPHLICFVRGDIAIILLNLVFCLVVFLFMRAICFVIYGSVIRARSQLVDARDAL